MSSHAVHPWQRHYRPDAPWPTDRTQTALQLWRRAVARGSTGLYIHSPSGGTSWVEIDKDSDALACGLRDFGVTTGDRVGILLQNDPEWIVALLAIWKAGAIAVTLNPMFKDREIGYHALDSGITALVGDADIIRNLGPTAFDGSRVSTIVLTNGEAVDALVGVRTFGYTETITAQATAKPPPVDPKPSDVAVLTYTSGTTGTPKGAMNTHGNIAWNAAMASVWYELDDNDVILAVAPLFHITGLVLHTAVSWYASAQLVLLHRFDPVDAVMRAEQYGATFTVGSITVYSAMIDKGGLSHDRAPTLQKLASGGAPIANATLARMERATGRYIHNVYGLTETTSPSHGVPLHSRAPVDASGAISVGIPMPSVNSWIRDLDTGEAAPPGTEGEIVIEGPGVVPGYWERPDESSRAIPGGSLFTGDIGVMDDGGWFYVIDRAKDQINASGFKIWPREVEDVLYEHADVAEAIVVGVPDEYRGETVKAYVVLRPQATSTPEDLIAFCRERLAAYKYPRQVEILDELPKTPTGKYLRRALKQT